VDSDQIDRALPQETQDYVPAVVNAMAAFGNSSQFVLSGDPPGAPQAARVVFASAEANDE
jgi:hypothetical protein